jgi:hypothetical protein
VAAAVAAATAADDDDEAQVDALIAAEAAAFSDFSHTRHGQRQQQLQSGVWGSAGGASTPGSSHGGSMSGSLPSSKAAAAAFLEQQQQQSGLQPWAQQLCSGLDTHSDPVLYQTPLQQQQQQALWDTVPVPNSGVWLPLSKQYPQQYAQLQQQQQQQRVSSSCGGDNSSSVSGYNSLNSSRHDSPVVLPAAAAAAAGGMQRAHLHVLSPAAAAAGGIGTPPLPPPALSGPAVAAMRALSLQQQREHQQMRSGSYLDELALQQWGSTCPNTSLEAELPAEEAAAAAAAAAGQQQSGGSPAPSKAGVGDASPQQQQQQQRNPRRKSKGSSPQQRLKHQWAQHMQQLQQKQQGVAGGSGVELECEDQVNEADSEQQQRQMQRRPRRSTGSLQVVDSAADSDGSMALEDPSSRRQQQQQSLPWDRRSLGSKQSSVIGSTCSLGSKAEAVVLTQQQQQQQVAMYHIQQQQQRFLVGGSSGGGSWLLREPQPRLSADVGDYNTEYNSPHDGCNSPGSNTAAAKFAESLRGPRASLDVGVLSEAGAAATAAAGSQPMQQKGSALAYVPVVTAGPQPRAQSGVVSGAASKALSMDPPGNGLALWAAAPQQPQSDSSAAAAAVEGVVIDGETPDGDSSTQQQQQQGFMRWLRLKRPLPGFGAKGATASKQDSKAPLTGQQNTTPFAAAAGEQQQVQAEQLQQWQLQQGYPVHSSPSNAAAAAAAASSNGDDRHWVSSPGCLQGPGAPAPAPVAAGAVHQVGQGASGAGNSANISSSSSNGGSRQMLGKWQRVVSWMKQQKTKTKQQQQQETVGGPAGAPADAAALLVTQHFDHHQQQQQCAAVGGPVDWMQQQQGAGQAAASSGGFASEYSQHAASASGASAGDPAAAAFMHSTHSAASCTGDNSAPLTEVASLAPAEAQQRVNSLDLEAEAAFADFATVNVEALQELNREKQQQEVLEPIAAAATAAAEQLQAVNGVNLAAAAAAAEQQYHLMLTAGYTAAAGSSSGGGSATAAAALQAGWVGSLPVTGLQQQWFLQQQQQYQAFLAQQQQGGTAMFAPGLQCYSGSLHSMADVVAAAAAAAESLQETGQASSAFSPRGLVFPSGPSDDNSRDMATLGRHQESPTGFVSEPILLMTNSLQLEHHTSHFQQRRQPRLGRLSSSSLDGRASPPPQQQQQQNDPYGPALNTMEEDTCDGTCGYWGATSQNKSSSSSGIAGRFGKDRSPTVKSSISSLPLLPQQQQQLQETADDEPDTCFTPAAAATAAAVAAAGSAQTVCEGVYSPTASGVGAAASMTASTPAAAAAGPYQHEAAAMALPHESLQQQQGEQQALPVQACDSSFRTGCGSRRNSNSELAAAGAAAACSSSRKATRRISYSVDGAAAAVAAAAAATGAGASPPARSQHMSLDGFMTSPSGGASACNSYSYTVSTTAVVSSGGSGALCASTDQPNPVAAASSSSGQLQPVGTAVAATEQQQQQLWRQPSPAAGNELFMGTGGDLHSAVDMAGSSTVTRSAIFKRLPRPCVSSSSHVDRMQLKQRLSEPGGPSRNVFPSSSGIAARGLHASSVGAQQTSSSAVDCSNLFYKHAAQPGSGCSGQGTTTSSSSSSGRRRGARRAASSVTWAAAAAAYAAANASSVAAAAAAAAVDQGAQVPAQLDRGSLAKPRRLSGSAIPRPGAPSMGPMTMIGPIVEASPASRGLGVLDGLTSTQPTSRSHSSTGGGIPHVMSMPSLSTYGSSGGGGSGYPPDAINWTHPPQRHAWQQRQKYSLAGAPPLARHAAGALLAAQPSTYSEDGSLQGLRYMQYSPGQAVRSSQFATYRSHHTGGGTAAAAGATAAVIAANPAVHHHDVSRLSMPATSGMSFAGVEGGGFGLTTLDVSDAFAAPPDVLRSGLATPRWPHGSLFASPSMGSLAVSDVGTMSPAAKVAAAALGDKRQFLMQLGAIAQDGSLGYKYRMSDNGGGGGRSFLQRAATCSLPGTLTQAALSPAPPLMPPGATSSSGAATASSTGLHDGSGV